MTQVTSPAIVHGFYSTLDPALAEEARVVAARIKDRIQTSIVDVGNDLLVMKEKLGHGRFGQWIDAEFVNSVRYAEDCMNAARCAAKYAITTYMPPTILVALASPSADPDVVKEVLDDVKAGKGPTTADVKERLSKAREAQRKADAARKKSPEQLLKEQKSEARRQASLEKLDREQKAIEASQVEAAGKIARLLVAGLGAGGMRELFTQMRRVAFYQVEQLFHHPSVAGHRAFLTELEIEERFGNEGRRA